MPIQSRAVAVCACLVVALCAPPLVRADTLKITSTPAGATVELNGVVVGTTPYQVKYPGGYFHGTKTIYGSLLGHPMRARVSLKGYVAKELLLTDGPMERVNTTGRVRELYYLIKSDHFDFALEKEPPPQAVSPSPHKESGEPGTGTVRFTSDPDGAEILVDGKFVGATPSTLRLAAGSHEVELNASGRQSWRRTLDVLKDSDVTLKAVLEPQKQP